MSSSTPQQRVHESTRRLLDLLETGDAISAEAIELRAELAEATAEAGHVDDAFYQADELFKDVQRQYGPDHAAIARCQQVADVIEAIAGQSRTDASGHQEKPDSSS